jgi:hypothetical protein
MEDLVNLQQLGVERRRPVWEDAETEAKEASAKFGLFKAELSKIATVTKGRMTVTDTGFCWNYKSGGSVTFSTAHLGRADQPNLVFGVMYRVPSVDGRTSAFDTEVAFTEAIVDFLATHLNEKALQS